MTIRAAKAEEYPRVLRFYWNLIDGMANRPYHPKWQKGIYPENGYLEESVRRCELYVAEEGDEWLAAMVLNHRCADGYEDVRWLVEAEPEEVTVLHTLGVAVPRMGQGVGKAMVREAIRLAKEGGQKAIRLDVLVGNLPAEKLYRGMGFRFITRQTLYYEDTGRCEFDLYEYPIDS